MSKEVIEVGGEKKVVREDTAKAYRGTIWALISVGAFLIIAAILFFGFFFNSAINDKPNENPSQIEQQRQ